MISPFAQPDGFLIVPGTQIALARTCVTVHDYLTFCSATARPSTTGLQLAPVVNVSAAWAEAYCKWLGAQLGRVVRLPTDGEWTAAACPDGRTYPWGEKPASPDPLPADLWRGSNTSPMPVGSFPAGAGPFGHLDLVGSVWEWTSTICGSLRLIRGGSFVNDAADVRAGNRLGYAPGGRDYDLGFRCAVELGGYSAQSKPDPHQIHRERLRAQGVDIESGRGIDAPEAPGILGPGLYGPDAEDEL